MSYALVLGGGGTVGVSWSIGVLSALADALGIDPAGAHVTIGTSAGSVVAAMLHRGKGLGGQVEYERHAGPSRDDSWATSFDIGLLAEVFQLWTTSRVMSAEVARQIGERALRASQKSADEWVAVLRERLGNVEWPPGDVRMTTVDCSSGERRVWHAGDGADVVRVVSASSAVPGLIPPIDIGDASYMDGGVWSLLNADLVKGTGVTDVLMLAPQAGAGVLAIVQALLVRVAGGIYALPIHSVTETLRIEPDQIPQAGLSARMREQVAGDADEVGRALGRPLDAAFDRASPA